MQNAASGLALDNILIYRASPSFTASSSCIAHILDTLDILSIIGMRDGRSLGKSLHADQLLNIL